MTADDLDSSFARVWVAIVLTMKGKSFLVFQRKGSQTMMTSSNGNIFRVTGHLCGLFTAPRWISRTKASNAELSCFLCAWINRWVNNREAGDLRRYRAHYDVIAMHLEHLSVGNCKWFYISPKQLFKLWINHLSHYQLLSWVSFKPSSAIFADIIWYLMPYICLNWNRTCNQMCVSGSAWWQITAA